MSITKILSNKDMPAEEKLEKVAEVVAAARAAYGNEEAVIGVPDVGTAHGSMPFNTLEDDSKVELLRSEIGGIKARAVEFDRQNEGANVNKKIEELLATNGYFVNVAPGTKFEYI